MTITISSSRSARWRRGLRALAGDPVLAADALAAMLVASALIRIAPFRWTMATAGWGSGADKATEADATVARCRRFAVGWARLMPWRAMCFEQGLTLQWLLRRRGIGSVLNYGVAQHDAAIDAHVWITLGDRIVLGADGLADHRLLLRRPEHSGPESRGA